MSKIGTIGCAALATTFLVMVSYYQPSFASNALLATAQSEFMTKARNALLERRIGEVSTNGVLAAATRPSVPAQPYIVASLEPVAAPSTVQVEMSAATAAPISSAATRDIVEMLAVVNELPEPAKVQVNSAGQENEVKPEVTLLPAQPAAQQNVTTAKGPEMAAPPIVAPLRQENEVKPEVALLPAQPAAQQNAPTAKGPEMAAPQVVAPLTYPVAPRPARAVQKTIQAPCWKTMIPARYPERAISRERLPYNLEALRARAPQIMAAIARYM